MGLALNNDGDAVQVLDGGGALVATFAYGLSGDLEALSDESYCRSPEVTGPFVAHSVASGDIDLLFSPGMKADGSNF